MPNRNIIVVASSSGGVEALVEIVRRLPAHFPATMFVVCHFPPGSRSVLPHILTRAGKLRALHATDGMAFLPGHIFIAPPDYHLVLGPGERMHLNREARENHHRPAADPLFRSAARVYGPRVIGVVLSGSLYDGAAGQLAIRAAGGLAISQDPRDALIAAMPQNATEIAGADYIVPAAELSALLVELVGNAVQPNPGDAAMDPIDHMSDVVAHDMAEQMHNKRGGEVSVFTCPECGGALWQVDQAGLIRFRCHVGHAYNGEALLADQTEALEAALWTAVRTFREKSVLGRQLAANERARGNEAAASRFEEQANQADQYGSLIVKHVLTTEPKLENKPSPGSAGSNPIGMRS